MKNESYGGNRIMFIIKKFKLNLIFPLLFVFLLVNIVLPQQVDTLNVGQTILMKKYNQSFFVGYSNLSATCQAKSDHLVVLTEDAHVTDVYGKIIDGTYVLYAATDWGVFTSTDTAKTWHYLGSVYSKDGTDPELTNPLGEIFVSVSPDNKYLLAGTHQGLYYSKDNGEKWNFVRTLPTDFNYYKVLFDTTAGSSDRKSKKFIASSNGLYFTAKTLTLARKNLSEKGMPKISGQITPVYDMELIQDSVLFLATEIGPFKGFIDEGGKEFSWEPIFKGNLNFEVLNDSADYKLFVLLADNISLGSHVFVKDENSHAMWAGNPEKVTISEDSVVLGLKITEDNLYFTGNFDGDYAALNPDSIDIYISNADKITQIELSDTGTLFFDTDSGIVAYNLLDASLVNYGLGNQTVNDLFLDATKLWAATDSGLYVLDLTNPDNGWNNTLPKLKDGLGVEEVNFVTSSIWKMDDAMYLVGNRLGGILKGDGSDWTTANLGLIHRGTDVSNITRFIHSFEDSNAIGKMGIFEQTMDFFADDSLKESLTKIYVLVTDLVDNYFQQAGNGVDYIFSRIDSSDQSPKTVNPNSNQRDIVYVDNFPVSWDPIEVESDGDTTVYLEAEASFTHSFARLLLYKMNPDLDEWLAEGMAMWARWINGYKFYNNPNETFKDLTVTISPRKENNILRWGDVDNILQERMESFVFFDFLFEKYLKNNTTVQQLIKDNQTSYKAVENFLNGKTFKEIYNDFVLTLHFDFAGPAFKNGMYALDSIDVENSELPLTWGLLDNPPYEYSIPGWAWTYFSATFWKDGKNNAPLLSPQLVFNGDDSTRFKVLFIGENSSAVDDYKKGLKKGDTLQLDTTWFFIDEMSLNEFNRGEYIPNVKRSEGDSVQYDKLYTIIVTNEPRTVDGGSYTMGNDTKPPSNLGLYPVQNEFLSNQFEVYAFANERLYVDGGQAPEIPENDEGPKVVATNDTLASEKVLIGFTTDSSSYFVYRGTFDLNSLMVGNSGTINFVMYGEDILGNKMDTLTAPVSYKLGVPGKPVTVEMEDQVVVDLPSGLKKKGYVTLYKTISNLAQVMQSNKSEDKNPIIESYVITSAQKPAGEFTISISYANLKDVTPEELSIYYKNGNKWEKVPSVVNKKEKTIKAVTNHWGQYRVQKSDADNETVALPEKYALKQNYPNPFNPQTVIEYQLPEKSHVTLTVYNVLGQKVVQLVNATQPAGFYKYKFDLTKLPVQLSSGIYFYRLKANNFTDVKKMFLIK